MSTVPTFDLLDGKKIPKLALGTATMDGREKEVERGLFALEAGLRAFDTAQGYPDEGGVGAFLAKTSVPRSEIFVVTKISQANCDLTAPSTPVSAIPEVIKTSTANLNGQPDIILIHNPAVVEPGKLVEFWQALEKLKDSGELTASLGVSNFRPQDLEEILAIAKYKPVVNQIEYHPYSMTHLAPVIEIQKKHGIVTMSYCPLSPLLQHPTGGPIVPILERIAARLSKETGKAITTQHALLLWDQAHGVVPLTSSSKLERLTALAELQSLGQGLTEEEVKEVDAAGQTIHWRKCTEHMEIDFPLPNLPSQ